MSSDVLTTPASVVAPHFCPVIHSFATQELAASLARSGFPSFPALLAAFENSVDRVTVRSSTYDPTLLPRFPVRFVERPLPPGFGDTVGAGSSLGRARSSTLLDASTSSDRPSVLPAAPATPATPFSPPTQGERDELFLDSLASAVAQRANAWIAHDAAPELLVRRPVKPKRKFPDRLEEGAAALPEPNDDDLQKPDEGWSGQTIEHLTPWYAAMRDEVFKRREMVPWDSFAWPVACLLAVSTSHPDPLNALSAMWDLTSKDKLFARSSFPPRAGDDDSMAEWAEPDVLRYVVLVHDFGAGGGREAWEDAQKLHETISKTYLNHTALLPLFSAAPTCASPQPRAKDVNILWPRIASIVASPPSAVGLGVLSAGLDDPGLVPEPPRETGPEKGQEISEDDLKALRFFVREMVVQSLVPYMERAVIVGNEQYAASKRSIGGRLFSAGRKYFGGSGSRAASPTGPGGTSLGYNPIKGFYPLAAQESQTRRLADLAFMIGDYKLAASIYDQASKDYKADRAWLHYSSACRMTGLALLLQHAPSVPLTFNPDAYLEQATQTPLAINQQGAVDLEGLQAVMMYYEAYRAIGDWRPAPTGLVRTAGESDEVASAMLLEQAALADLHLPVPARRKYGFHMAMAAARYEKSGLKSLSRRCLAEAATLYRVDPPLPHDPRWTKQIRSWTAIRAHVHHGLGRQAYNVGKSADAVEHFLELLVGAGEGDEEWLDDFALAWEHLGSEAPRIVAERGLKLPVTVFDPKDAHVRLPQTHAEGLGSSETWAALEAELFPSTLPGKRGAKIIVSNEAVVGETFYLELQAVNPLDAPLVIGGLGIETDADAGVVEVDPPAEIKLGPLESLRVYVPVRVSSLVTFSFTKLSFRFNDLFPCCETLVGRPKRLNATREQLALATYAQDASLKVTVRSPVPILSIALDLLPDQLYAGEVRMTSLTFINSGPVPLTALRGVCSHPAFAIFLPPDETGPLYAQAAAPPQASSVEDRLHPNTPSLIPLDASDTLASGASVSIPILLRGDTQGVHTIQWLFAFQDHGGSEQLTARASQDLKVTASLDIRPVVRPGSASSPPFLIGIEVRNTGITDDVVITQISSIAPRWQCQPAAAFETQDQTTLASLGQNEWANLFVSVIAAPTKPSSTRSTDFAVRKLDDLLQGKDVTTSAPGSVQLYYGSSPSTTSIIDVTSQPLFSSILRTHLQLRHRSLTNQLPTVSATLHQHLFTLFNPRAIDLLVFWTIPSTGLSGHHHLADIPLSAGSNLLKEVLETAELKAGGLYAESQRERSALLAGLRRSELGVDANPSEVVLEVEALITHDFATGPCIVPVSFHIRNLSGDNPLSYTLFLHDSDTSTAPSPNRLPYAGALIHQGTVAPLTLDKVTTQLWIARPGNYEVGDWRLESRGISRAIWQVVGSRRTVRVRAPLV